MVELSYLLALAVLMLQLYICACTYWLVRKIDRYENVALGIIERYLSRGVPHARRRKYDVSSIDRVSETTLVSNDVSNYVGNDVSNDNAHLQSRRNVNAHINRVLSYAPERIQNAVNEMLTKWYCQVCIDLVSVCMQHSNSIKNEIDVT